MHKDDKHYQRDNPSEGFPAGATVRRVRERNGSHIEPPLDPDWSQLDKLHWHAAVVLVDSGLVIRVEAAREKPGRFVLFGAAAYGSPYYRFDEAWDEMNGWRKGAEHLQAQLASVSRVTPEGTK